MAVLATNRRYQNAQESVEIRGYGLLSLRAGFSKEAVKQVLAQGGSLSREQLLRCRVRYFTDGVAIGSRAFAENIFLSSRDWFGSRRKTGARAMRNAKDIGLVSMRDLQLSPISIR